MDRGYWSRFLIRLVFIYEFGQTCANLLHDDDINLIRVANWELSHTFVGDQIWLSSDWPLPLNGLTMKIRTVNVHLIRVPLKLRHGQPRIIFWCSCLLVEIETDMEQGVGQVVGPNLTLVRDYVKQFGNIISMDARSSTLFGKAIFMTSPRPYADAKDVYTTSPGRISSDNRSHWRHR